MNKNPLNKQTGFGLIVPLIIIALLSTTAVVVTQYRSGVESQNNTSLFSASESSDALDVVPASTTTEQQNENTEVDVGTEMTSGAIVQDAPNKERALVDSGMRATITLAGGCFWCTEAYLQETAGVVDAVSGYAGGSEETATYKEVSTGKTNHREAVQVTYDPARISLREVLDVYWVHIDPTDGGGQFADRGPQYQTAIFYSTEEEKRIAEESKNALAASGLFNEPIATVILPFTTFYEAEEYHQDYYKKAAEHYERYKKASGRAGFIEDNWAKDAALQFFAEQEAQAQNDVVETTTGYVEREWSEEEILAGLAKLPADVYHIVAEEGTEPAYKNAFFDNKEAGIYVDVVTGRPLYSSTHKYDSGTGWPSFYRPINEEHIIYKVDNKLSVARTEVRSDSGHLGHVFNDGPSEYGGKRHCINSLALVFIPKEDMKAKGYSAYLYLFE